MGRPVAESWGTWESHEEEQLVRWAALSLAQRLDWLEEAKEFYAQIEEARRSGRLRSSPVMTANGGIQAPGR